VPVRPLVASILVELLVAAAACSRAPEPSDPERRYNLAGTYSSDMIVREKRYSGSIELATRASGALSGVMKLTNPIAITAELSGFIVGDSVAFDGPYRTPDCTGVLRARGRVDSGGRSAWGVVNIDDGCVGAMAGSFRLER
jgi:hypothetical protein